MNPNDVIQIGPLALALDRLVAVGLILGFLTATEWIVRRFRVPVWQPAGLALLAGLAGARAAYVWVHRESFALDPLTALQPWLGGWSWIMGVVAAALVLIATLRQPRPVAASLALLSALSLVWWVFTDTEKQQAPILLPASLLIEKADGGSIAVASLRGRPAVLNLWASWCPPCRREMPMLVKAAGNERRAAILLVNQGENQA